MIPMRAIVVAVGIPCIKAITGRSHKTTAGLYEAAREEHTMAKAVAAIGILCFVGFLAQVECVTNGFGKNHVPRLLRERIALAYFGDAAFGTILFVDQFQESLPIVQTIEA